MPDLDPHLTDTVLKIILKTAEHEVMRPEFEALSQTQGARCCSPSPDSTQPAESD